MHSIHTAEAVTQGNGRDKLKEMVKKLQRVDFSSSQVVLIPSVPGSMKKADRDKYGHMKLRRLLEREAMHERFHPTRSGTKQIGVISQFASIPSHKDNGKWVREEFERTLASRQGSLLEEKDLKQHIVWPRKEDVKSSNEGLNGGKGLPCPSNNVYMGSSSAGGIHYYLKERLAKYKADHWERSVNQLMGGHVHR